MAGIIVEDSSAHRYDTQPIQLESRRGRFRTITAVFDLLLIPLTIASLLSSHSLGVAAQGTNATCNSGFEWMTNSKNQSPCLVSSWLFTPCYSSSDSFVYPLSPGFHYNTPLNSTESATPCRCNTVLFSTISACATCQGQGNYTIPYPVNIPSGTAIPAWAYLDVRVNNTFDPAAAEAVAAQDLPESSASPGPTSSLSTTQTSESESTTGTSTASYTYLTDGSASGTPSATSNASSSESGSKKSNAGPIAGGVVGGIAGVALIGAAVFFIPRLRSRHGGAPQGSWEQSPVTSAPSIRRFYDPNNPRTFPDHDPFANGPAQVSMASPAGVVSSNWGTGVASAQNSYHGTPEL
ncbi:hypothetical protein GSI_02898 [Ganoderma sinense ZZ0214-1]|uniref:Uncharacterized protein n=1 Tax=Ganoderma sinense ZZ0214-1 TaxID=1077348 RepID=A0A2G8SMX6_9APHY|nr:hypothetical protein GSI_02898 [Ganoderma sinense ZZ0214-1]